MSSSSRKGFSNEGIGRIWKTTLAQTVDSAGSGTKKDISQRVHNHESASRKSLNDNDKDDDLDAVNIQAALQNIRSLPGSGHAADGSFQISQDDKESNSNSTVKNIVVKISNDNTPTRRSDHSHGTNGREVRENKMDTRDHTQNGIVSQGRLERGSSHRMPDKNIRRNDAMNHRRRDEHKNQNVAPRLKGLQYETRKAVEGKHQDETNPDSLKTQKVVVFDMKDEKTTSFSSVLELEGEKELDAYDKWKMKRQKSASTQFTRPRTHNATKTTGQTNSDLTDLRDVDLDSFVSSEKVKSFKVSSSQLKMSDSEPKPEDTNTNDDRLAGHILSNTSFDSDGDKEAVCLDGYDQVWADKVMREHDIKNESPIPHGHDSAMDKIQSLFQTYTSPVNQIRGSNQSKSDAERHHGTETISSNNDRPALKNGDDSHLTSIKDRVFRDSCNDNDDVEMTEKDHQVMVDKTMSKSMEFLQLTDNKHTSIQNVEPEKSGLGKDETLKKEQSVDSPSYNDNICKYPPNIQSLMKSPASIPSGFSSDYDVGIVSQSQSETEEDDESPHPCAANLFPSSNSNPSEKVEQEHDFSTSTPLSQWHRFYSNQQPLPRHQMPYPLPPWFHPYYNHPDPFRHPYHPMSNQPSHYPGFMGTESCPFPGQQPPAPQSQTNQSTKCKNKLIIPVDKFADEDSLYKIIDFVATKKEEWDKFMISRHGQAVPVDVVVSVTLAGVTTEDDDAGGRMRPNAYPAHSAWQYPMYPQPNMAYNNYNSYWAQSYSDNNGAYSMHDMKMPREPRLMEKEERYGDSLKERPPPPETDISRDSNCLADLEAEDMKRRALSFEDGACGDGEGQAYKKRIKDHNRDKIQDENESHKDVGEEEDTKSSISTDKHFRISNSMSRFLNPNDLKNDWQTPPKPLSSSTKQSKYDLVPGQESCASYSKERDRSPHSLTKRQQRNYRSNQHNRSFENDDDQGHASSSAPTSESHLDVDTSKKTSYDQQSVCVVERKSAPVQSRLNEKRLSREGEDYEPIAGKSWADICPEPEIPADDNSFSSYSSTQDFFSPKHRRRSDSVVSYGSDDRSPLARDNRLSKTPGHHYSRHRGEDLEEWKALLMARSKTYNHEFIDTHCHIDFMYHRTNMATIPFRRYMENNNDSFPENYGGCVAVFCNPKVFSEHTQAYGILQLLVKEDNVWVAIGCHPKSATDFTTHHLLRLKRFLTTHPKVVALGEIGLDYSGSFHNHAHIQKRVFVQQLDLALELKLPLVIHCRDADTDCLEIMKKNIPADHKIHLHCFTRHFSICRKYMEHFPNLYVGFTPLITYRSARDATEAAAMVPLNRLLLETDAPYFLPHGVESPDPNNTQKKGISHPGMALFTAERIAFLKKISVDTVLEACRENTRFVYGV